MKMFKHQMKKKNVAIVLIIVLAVVGATVACAIYNHFDLSQMLGLGNSTVNANSNISVQILTDNGQSIQGQATSESTQQILDDLKKKEVYVTDSIGSCITFSGKTGDNATWKVQNLPDNNVIEQVDLFYNNQLIHQY